MHTLIVGSTSEIAIEFIKNNNLSESISFAEYLCFPDEVIKGAKKYIKSR